MSKIEEIRKRLKQGYTVSLYGSQELVYEQMEDDISSLPILFSAKKRVIESRIEELEEQIKFINNSVFKGSMSASKELHRLRGIKKELKNLLI